MLVEDDSFVEFFESVESSGSGTVTSIVDIPINTNYSKKVVV